jgi:hypothetical protein
VHENDRRNREIPRFLSSGFTSKIDARADGQGRALGFVLTGGEVSDCRAVPALIDLPITRPKMMLAD